MPLDTERIKRIMRALILTREEEIGCDTCFEQVDRYAEMLMQGKDPEQVMPLVKAHLEICRDCKEEFEALIEALKSLQ